MSSGQPSGETSREYFVRVTKSSKRYHALKFSATNDVEFTNGTKAELAREGGHYQYKAEWEALPKVGTGSEFNRENREMARRKKFGFNSKGHSIDDMPWILTHKTEAGKEIQYRAKRSVSDNSSYFVFINNAEIGGFEAYPLEDWYTFAPYRTYKTLTIEEAEEEFSRRHKTLNKYAIMANRRRAKDDIDEDAPSSGGRGKAGGGRSAAADDGDDDMTKKKGVSKKDFSDMIMSGDEENLSDDDDDEGSRGGDSDDNKAKSRKKGKGRAGGGGDDDGDEMKVNEDSDDGDHDGDEVDYSSIEEESSDSDFEQTKNVEKYEEKGIDEDVAMKALETEESEDDEENLTEEGKVYKKLISQTMKDDDEASKDSAKKSIETNSSDSSDNEIDPDNDPIVVSTLFDNKKNFLNPAFSDSTASTTGKSKRKATDDLSTEKSSSKRSNKESTEDTKTIKANLIKAATTGASFAPATPTLMFEDEVIRYLKRKPMTIKELINKFKKNSTMEGNDLSNHLGKIFNKLKESKDFKVEEKNGIKYLSLYAPGK